jgi:putative ABC transport system ATP-binding protein
MGQPLSSMSANDLARLRRRTVGYVFQDLNLLPGLTAAENVSLPLELDGVSLGPARAAAVDLLERVGLSELIDRFPEDLSGGEQQRVAIARAMIGDRRLVLADEPTGALDTVTGETVMRLLRAACDDTGAAGVLVTHDAGHAAWADRIVFLRDGCVVDQAGGTAADRAIPAASKDLGALR